MSSITSSNTAKTTASNNNTNSNNDKVKVEHEKTVHLATHRGVDPGVPLVVNNTRVHYTSEEIISNYVYNKIDVQVEKDKVVATPQQYNYTFKTKRRVPRAGVMLVGWGGNNGSTVTAAILANRHNITWRNKDGVQKPNYFGSLTQATTIYIGSNAEGKEVHLPFKSILPMVNPNDMVIGGWDINGANLADSMERACVLEYDLQRQLRPHMEKLKPLPSVYYPDFIAANQEDRANNLIPKGNKKQDLEHIRRDIREFKKANKLDWLSVLWTANTERFVDVRAGLNMTAQEVLASIDRNDPEISQSQIFAVASILEGCPYINGSPQNTLVPGIIELAAMHGVFVGGDDFKSGQTKMKSVLVDFLVSAGLKVQSIVSYNHLGNNDGKNLSAPQQFRSKEISKSNVVDDMVAANHLLYAADESPDHCVVIKYVPYVKDSKRAMDEYMMEIFMNGKQTIVLHNTCEDSLLAAPLIIDLVILTELMSRVTYKTDSMKDFAKFDPVLSLLAYLLKAPLVTPGTPVVNALMKQQRCITNILCACAGLPPDTDMLLEHKTKLPVPNTQIKAKL